MGFFSKIINGLKKTKNNISDKIAKIFHLGIGDEFYEELENILISADVGGTAAMEIVDELRERVSEERIKDCEPGQGAAARNYRGHAGGRRGV